MTLLPARGTPTTVTEAAKTAQSIGHVRPSKSDTCETQKQLAEQSSRIDTIIAGQERVYKADCQKPVKTASKSEGRS